VILTRRGWLTYDEIQPGDETIGYNGESGRSEWTPITAVHYYEDAPLIRLSNKTWEAACTPHHRWAADHWKHVGKKGRQGRTQNEYTREGVFVEALHITTRHSLRLAAEAETGEGPAISLQEAELLGWVLGDGWVAYPKSRTPGSTHWRTQRGTRPSIRLGQAKPEHVKRIDELVAGLLFTRTVRQMRTPAGAPGLPLVTWEFHRPYSAELLKRSGYDHENPVPFVLSLSPTQREAFLRGVHGADGGYAGDGEGFGDRGYHGYARTKVYYQNDGPQQEAIILAIYLSGYRPGIQVKNNSGKKIGRWTVSTTHAVISETRPFIGGEKVRREQIENAPVWCVTTGLGSWTMRQGRNVMLTGNSFNWYDQGGVLPPGVTMAVNNTGRNERVVPPCGDDAVLAELKRQNMMTREQNLLLAQQLAVARRAPAQSGISFARTINGASARAVAHSAYAVRRPIA